MTPPSTNNTPARPKRALDGIQAGRGLAALAVVCTHAVAHPFGGAPPFWHMLGRYGVTLFFVISGLIMVHATGAGTFDPLRFAKHRVRRIVPIYYVANAVLLVTVIAAPHAFHRTEYNLRHIILSLLFIPSYEPAGTGFIWPFFRLGWTLNYEMFFYASFAALFALRARSRAIALSVWFGMLIAIGVARPFTDAIPRFYTQIDTLGFLAGVWLGVLEIEGRLRLRSRVALVATIVSLTAYAVITWAYADIKDNPWTQVCAVAICATHVALLVSTVDQAGRPVPRWMLASGDASYSIYLFHMFAIGAVTALAHHLPAILLYPSMAVAAISGAAIGIGVYRFIERPLNRLVSRRDRHQRIIGLSIT